ncbi:hypothetical protein [Pseudobutyrivibrio ruminis]|uniref:hypothetical protein n=1 Tax=Pseudobutyrivibrio ruminis TaxID=46206 RepID=UPI00051B02CB|nr:hypothetical protein [Pseudobutyrivibrio ruminis]
MKKVLLVLCTLALTMTACGNKEVSSDIAPVVDSTEEVETSEEVESSDDDSESNKVVNLDEYVGYYTNYDYEVTISNDGSNYSMSVIIYGLANIDEGEVKAGENSVIFDAVDPNGEPIEFSFYKASDDSYTLEVEKTTWEYFEVGTKFEGLLRDNADGAN